jgi:hypothetical protein
MNIPPLLRFLDRIEELPAPVQIRLSQSERAARQELSESLAAGTHSQIRTAVDRYMRALRSLPAPVLIQLPTMAWLEEWDAQ